MSVADEIEKLTKLKESGALSEEEFQKAKESLLKKNQSAGEKIRETMDGITADTNLWCMLIHLTQFCGYIIPFAGLIVPIILWQIKKDDSPVIDQHGRVAANWILSAIIYGVIGTLLCLIIVGYLLLAILFVLTIVFPIVAGIKANSGELWKYPLSITFFEVDESVVPLGPEKQISKPE